MAYLRSQKFSPSSPNFTVTSFGGHPGVKGNGYVPYYMVFDHRGKLVHHHMCGAYHGGDGLKMIEWVDKLLKDAPALYLGPEEYTRVSDLAERIATKRKLANDLRALEKRAASSRDAAEQEEIARIRKWVVRYRDGELKRIDGLLKTRPSTVLASLKKLEAELKGSELATAVDARAAELESGDALKRAIAVEKTLAKVQKKLARKKACKSCRRSGARYVRLDCPECRAQHKRAFKKAVAELEKALAASDGLPIAETVTATLESLR
jgi:hypothetical protein